MLQWDQKYQELNHGLNHVRYVGNTRPTKYGIVMEANTNVETVFV